MPTAAVRATNINAICSECGTIKKSGKRSCCGRGGSWFGHCGSAENANLTHTWYEGIRACEAQQSETQLDQQRHVNNRAVSSPPNTIIITPPHPKGSPVDNRIIDSTKVLSKPQLVQHRHTTEVESHTSPAHANVGMDFNEFFTAASVHALRQGNTLTPVPSERLPAKLVALSVDSLSNSPAPNSVSGDAGAAITRITHSLKESHVSDGVSTIVQEYGTILHVLTHIIATLIVIF